MNRKSFKGIFTKQMDAHAADPVIENNELQEMQESIPATASAAEGAADYKSNLMDDPADNSPELQKGQKTGNVMQPFNEGLKNTASPNVNYKDQQPDTGRQTVSGSYIVLRMHVQNGTMTVIGSKKVNSPLLISENIIEGGLTYETFKENNRIAIGSIPDFGEQRSFPRPGKHEHHFTYLPSFDFNLRLPADKVSLTDLTKLNVTLYRFKESIPELKLNSSPLDVQYAKEVRVVAQLNGIQLSELKEDVRRMVDQSFKDE